MFIIALAICVRLFSIECLLIGFKRIHFWISGLCAGLLGNVWSYQVFLWIFARFAYRGLARVTAGDRYVEWLTWSAWSCGRKWVVSGNSLPWCWQRADRGRFFDEPKLNHYRNFCRKQVRFTHIECLVRYQMRVLWQGATKLLGLHVLHSVFLGQYCP